MKRGSETAPTTSRTPEATSGASDFSQAAVERRIEAGYRDALTQLEEFGRRSPQDRNRLFKLTRQAWQRGIC